MLNVYLVFSLINRKTIILIALISILLQYALFAFVQYLPSKSEYFKPLEERGIETIVPSVNTVIASQVVGVVVEWKTDEKAKLIQELVDEVDRRVVADGVYPVDLAQKLADFQADQEGKRYPAD